MAIEIKAIPTLEGKKASLFIEKVEKESKKKVSSDKVTEIRNSARLILLKAKF
jgi:hypothetical protein